jgi:hypothetical protein
LVCEPSPQEILSLSRKTNAGHGISVNTENVGGKRVFVTSKIIIYHMLLRLLYTPLELTALSEELKRNASGTFFSFIFSSKKSNQDPDLISFCCSMLRS